MEEMNQRSNRICGILRRRTFFAYFEKVSFIKYENLQNVI